MLLEAPAGGRDATAALRCHFDVRQHAIGSIHNRKDDARDRYSTTDRGHADTELAFKDRLVALGGERAVRRIGQARLAAVLALQRECGFEVIHLIATEYPHTATADPDDYPRDQHRPWDPPAVRVLEPDRAIERQQRDLLR